MIFGFIRKMLQPHQPAQRIELRLVPYGTEADKLIAEGWIIAQEEDSNRTPFHVYLEKLEQPMTHAAPSTTPRRQEKP